ncbi:MAG: NAD(P)-dependent oxidoreductase [Chloroflexota bacterium]|nr:NAD(P)-dependent oxidoreductase [Chloroflexota bacterium]
MTTVLITGAAGYIGSYILPAFRKRFDLRLVDNRDRDGLGRPVEGLQVRDLSDLNRMDEYRDLFRGADAVVHLAFMRPATDDLHARYLSERANVDMAYIVYQLALEEGVRRGIVASSNHAADFYERPMRTGQVELIRPDAPRPLADNFYGWAKEVYEHLGFVYASGVAGGPTVGEVRPEDRPRRLEVVQIRIGAPRDLASTTAVQRPDDPRTFHRDLGMWVSPRDLAQLFVKSVEAPNIEDEYGIPFQVFNGMSANTRSAWSLANARKVIGYAPEDDSEVVYADEIRRIILEPARASMVQGEARGGKGSR